MKKAITMTKTSKITSKYFPISVKTKMAKKKSSKKSEAIKFST